MRTLLLLFLCMQKSVPKGSDSQCWYVEKRCLVSSDVCYGARGTIVAPSAYAHGLYIDACKGYCLLLAQHCGRQTKRTCIKGLDSSSLFMWKWMFYPKGTKTALSRGVIQLGSGGRRGQAGAGGDLLTRTNASKNDLLVHRGGVKENTTPTTTTAAAYIERVAWSRRGEKFEETFSFFADDAVI